jgi:integrase
MPRPRPPHVHREVTRHGKVLWYYRVDHGPRIRIKHPLGTPEFDLAYRAIVGGAPLAAPEQKFNAKTLGWLIEQYRHSTAWTESRKQATRALRGPILKAVCESAGKASIAAITPASIEKGMARRTPHSARHFLYTMRALFVWAVKAQHTNTDPTVGLKAIVPAGEGHTPWSEEWCAAFEKRWPLGTRERLAYDVLFYSGLRVGDAVRLGRPHVKNNIATIRTEKTGEIVSIPILPPLQASLAAGPVGELTFIASSRGQPLHKVSFINWFRCACDEAGVPGTAHGLRKAAATRAADNGATEAELEALFGWRGGHMASLYTRTANRAKLARGAADKLLTEQDVNIYSRTSKTLPTPKKII